MDVNDDFRLEEQLFGSEGGRESTGEWSSDTPQETTAKQTKKRPRVPTVKIKEMKKMGAREKWVRDRRGGSGPYICTMRMTASCGAPLHLWLLLLGKRETTLRA